MSGEADEREADALMLVIDAVAGKLHAVDQAARLVADKADEWRWRLRAANGQIIAVSGEGYKDKRDCLHAIDLVKSSKDAEVGEATN